jgi:hypothetical protein
VVGASAGCAADPAVVAWKFAKSGWLCHNPRARRPADRAAVAAEVLIGMIPKSEYRFSAKIMLKCKPHAQDYPRA